jgi:hypothetical protein
MCHKAEACDNAGVEKRRLCLRSKPAPPPTPPAPGVTPRGLKIIQFVQTRLQLVNASSTGDPQEGGVDEHSITRHRLYEPWLSRARAKLLSRRCSEHFWHGATWRPAMSSQRSSRYEYRIERPPALSGGVCASAEAHTPCSATTTAMPLQPGLALFI